MPVIVPLISTSTLWSKVKFFWQQALAAMTMSATSESAGYAKENIYDTRESNLWKATSTADQYLWFDAGVGGTYAVDYLTISGHNLATCGATLRFRYADGWAWTDAFAPFVPASDGIILMEIDLSAHRQWSIEIIGPTAIPFIQVAIFGQKTELDHAWGSFDPAAQEKKDNIVFSQNGYLLGIHERYTEIQIALKFQKVLPDLYAKFLDWWNGCGQANFFIAWETSEHPSDVYLVHSDAKFTMPFEDRTCRYRQGTISLRGRKP
jgi:hypothetical protein